MKTNRKRHPSRMRRRTLYAGGVRCDGEMTLLQAIRHAMIDQQRKQSEVALLADIKDGNLSEFLNGKRSLRQDSLDRLMAVLGLKIEGVTQR